MFLALTNYNAMDNVYYKNLIFPFNTLDVNAPRPTALSEKLVVFYDDYTKNPSQSGDGL